jgi:hypothetical protein
MDFLREFYLLGESRRKMAAACFMLMTESRSASFLRKKIVDPGQRSRGFAQSPSASQSFVKPTHARHLPLIINPSVQPNPFEG